MTYMVLNTIRHLRSFVQQLGGEILHFSLHLWTAINRSFVFYVLYGSNMFLLRIVIFLLILTLNRE